jgi:hypothetical protein
MSEASTTPDVVELTRQVFKAIPPMHGTVEGGGYRGREGFEAYRAELSETWEERRLVAEELLGRPVCGRGG